MHVGAYEILPVIDGAMRVQPSRAYRTATDAAWEPHRALLEKDGLLELALGGFLVRGGSGGRTVLVDLGLGRYPLLGSSPGGKLLDSLAALGVKTEDVTDVLFSHLHFDHVGWASVDGAAVFANATYRCDRRDWAYWIDGPGGVRPDGMNSAAALPKELLEPIASRFEMWEGDGTVVPGIDSLHSPGHTPGSAILVVSDAGSRALLLGDVVHCAIELIDDEWGGMGDLDPELAKRTRNALARELEGKNVPAAAAHFPGMQFGRLIGAEGKRRWVA